MDSITQFIELLQQLDTEQKELVLRYMSTLAALQ